MNPSTKKAVADAIGFSKSRKQKTKVYIPAIEAIMADDDGGSRGSCRDHPGPMYAYSLWLVLEVPFWEHTTTEFEVKPILVAYEFYESLLIEVHALPIFFCRDFQSVVSFTRRIKKYKFKSRDSTVITRQ